MARRCAPALSRPDSSKRRSATAGVRSAGRARGATIEVACEYARSRRDAFDASTAVLIHGDAHPANVLEDLADGSPRTFKLVDPDGMRSEPAHDLAIPLRDWSDELLASDPVALGRAWCVRLADRTGTDPQAIWEWAFVERVSTGLFLIQLGDQLGARLLEVAAAWTGEQPERVSARGRRRSGRSGREFYVLCACTAGANCDPMVTKFCVPKVFDISRSRCQIPMI